MKHKYDIILVRNGERDEFRDRIRKAAHDSSGAAKTGDCGTQADDRRTKPNHQGIERTAEQEFTEQF